MITIRPVSTVQESNLANALRGRRRRRRSRRAGGRRGRKSIGPCAKRCKGRPGAQFRACVRACMR